MVNLLFILVALLILCVIVVAHELGHYIAGRLCGIGIEEFSVGFGPRLAGFRRSGIDYSLRAIPLGGFCKFVGEDEENSAANAMNNQPVWKRFITILSGPVMNFVLAFLVVAVFLMAYGYNIEAPAILGVGEGTPAAAAGLELGDVITAVDGAPLEFNRNGVDQLRAAILDSSGDLLLSIEREGEALSLTLTPVITAEGAKQIGITMGARQHSSITQVVPQSFQTIKNITVMMLDSLKNLVFRGEGLDETMGPVGIIGFMSQEARNGMDSILNLIVIISLNLGIMNLLPFPALDGGRLVFLVIEAIRKKPMKAEHEGWVHAAGFMVLIGLILVITYKDIVRMITGG